MCLWGVGNVCARVCVCVCVGGGGYTRSLSQGIALYKAFSLFIFRCKSGRQRRDHIAQRRRGWLLIQRFQCEQLASADGRWTP
jgi:hypothetical protein